jgi:predicted RNA-binding protein with PUA-like domain
MANHWLVKSEPDVYSIADLERDRTTDWTGVRNNAAALHLKAMRVGDEVFFYHSNQGKEIVGIAKVVREAFPDTTDEKGRFVAVELGFVRTLKQPVPLADIKASPALQDIRMLRENRLSVSPVTDAEWKTILKMAGE